MKQKGLPFASLVSLPCLIPLVYDDIFVTHLKFLPDSAKRGAGPNRFGLATSRTA